MSDGNRLPMWKEDGARAVGAGVAVAVLGYGAVALATGIESSAALATIARPGALGLYPGVLLAGWLDGGALRRAADTGFRVGFVATAVAQGALFFTASPDAPFTFLLLGLMGTALVYALPATLVGAAGAALRHRWERDPEVGIDV
jgi:hypothetical protein